MSLLRPQHRLQTGSHIHIRCIKCFSTLICCVWWVYGTTFTVICLCRSGVDFGVLGVDLEPKWCCVVMSWLRLQQASDCGSHIHIGCIQSVLLAPWYYAVYEHMGLPLHSYTSAGSGVDFEVLGIDLSEPKWCCNIMVEATTGFRRDPISILDV